MPDEPVPSNPTPLSQAELDALLAKPVSSVTLMDLKQLGILDIDKDKEPQHALRVNKADLETLAGLVAERLQALNGTAARSAPAGKAATTKPATQKGAAKTAAVKKAASKVTKAKKAPARKSGK